MHGPYRGSLAAVLLLVTLAAVCCAPARAREDQFDLSASPGVNATPGVISFTLAEPGRARVRVLSGSGQVLAVVLPETQLDEGQYCYAWEPKDAKGEMVPEGLYTVELTIHSGGGQRVETTKVRVGGVAPFSVHGTKDYAIESLFSPDGTSSSAATQSLTLQVAGGIARGISVQGTFDDTTAPAIASARIRYDVGSITLSAGDVTAGAGVSAFLPGERRILGASGRYASGLGSTLSVSGGATQATVSYETMVAGGFSQEVILGHSPVLPESEEVTLEGTLLTRDVDYIADYASGTIVLLAIPPRGSPMSVRYEYLPDKRAYRTILSSASGSARMGSAELSLSAQRLADDEKSLDWRALQLPAPSRVDLLGGRLRWSGGVLSADGEFATSEQACLSPAEDLGGSGSAHGLTLRLNSLKATGSVTTKAVSEGFTSLGRPDIAPGSQETLGNAELRLAEALYAGGSFSLKSSDASRRGAAYLRLQPRSSTAIQVGVERRREGAIMPVTVVSLKSNTLVRTTAVSAGLLETLSSPASRAAFLRWSGQPAKGLAAYAQIDAGALSTTAAGGLKWSSQGGVSAGLDAGLTTSAYAEPGGSCRAWLKGPLRGVEWDGRADWATLPRSASAQLNAAIGPWSAAGAYNSGQKDGKVASSASLSYGLDGATTRLSWASSRSAAPAQGDEAAVSLSRQWKPGPRADLSLELKGGRDLRADKPLVGGSAQARYAVNDMLSARATVRARWAPNLALAISAGLTAVF